MGIWRGHQRGHGRLGRNSQSSSSPFLTLRTKFPQLSTFLILLVETKIWLCVLSVLDRGGGVGGLESDVGNFVSFRDVTEWALVYKQCDPEYNYISTYQNITSGQIPLTLSPIPLPASNKALKPVKLNNKTDPRVLYIYTTNPPDLADYALSYGFQKDKECLVDDEFNSCKVSPSFGLVRGVVLSAQRESLLHIKKTFDTEDPEKFVSIVSGNNIEKKFHEAIFMGHAKGSNGSRSTHTVDGKAYPMEIYMFFVDETLEAMAATTVLVVLVEEGEEDNPHVFPLINAINNHLFNAERKWIKDHEVEIQREQMYHHMGQSLGVFPTYFEEIKRNQYFHMEASWELEQQNADYQDSFEKLLRLDTRLRFDREELSFVNKVAEKRTVLAGEYYSSLFEKESEFRWEYEWLLSCIDKLVSDDKNSNKTSLIEDIIPADERTKPERKDAWESLVMFHQQRKILDEARIKKDGKDELSHILRIREQKKALDSLMEKVRRAIFKSQYPKGNLSEEQRLTVKSLSRYYYHQLQLRNLLERQEVVEKKIETYIQGTGYANSDDQDNWFSTMRELFEWLVSWEVPTDLEPHPIMKMEARKLQSLTLGNMEMKINESTFAKKEHVIIPLRNQFQISWLIPDGGGYYLYKGSSPVPPCYQTARTIVFKKPIKMSFDQIQALTTIPTHFDKQRNIQNTLGRLHQLRRPDFPVYFEKRNHQFLGSDGVHKNSVLEAAKRRQALGGCGLVRINYYLLLLILLLFVLPF